MSVLRSCRRGSVAGCSSFLRCVSDCCSILSICLSSCGWTCAWACCLRLGGRHALRLELAAICCSCSARLLVRLVLLVLLLRARACRGCDWSALAGCLDRSTLISSGPLVPGAEARGQPVGGPPRVGALGQRAVVLLAEVEVERGQRRAPRARRGRRARTAADARATNPPQRRQPCGSPSCLARAGAGAAGGRSGRRRSPSSAGSSVMRGEHRDRDDERRRVAERRHERDVDDGEREQRDHHRAAGEHAPRRPRSRSRARSTRRVAIPSRRCSRWRVTMNSA